MTAVVALVDDGAEIYTDRLSLSSARSRGAFASELQRRFPDLKGRDVEAQLLELLLKIPKSGEVAQERVTQAQTLVALAKAAGHEYFHDARVPFVSMSVDGHREIRPVRSSDYRRWLSWAYWNEEGGRVPSTDAVASAIMTLEGHSCFEGAGVKLSNRVAWDGDDGCVWYDLTDDKWRAIRVSPEGWEVVDHPPILFQRFAHQRPQVEPKRGGDPLLLFEFLPALEEAQRCLLFAYIGTLFVPGISHAIVNFHGDPGSGKTTAARIISEIIDPSRTPVLAPPKDPSGALQLLSHHYLCLLDNLSSIPEWLSDALCRACTGEGASKRQLFTDDDDVIYSFKRCIGLSGVNLVADRPDLLDRSIIFRFERVRQVKTDDELEREFAGKLPLILGGLLDVLVKAMAIRPRMNLTRLSRLADFTSWGAAIAVAGGYSREEFMQAYSGNLRTQNETALSASMVAGALMAFMTTRDEWSGTPAELLSKLESSAEDLKISTRQRGWPKNPVWLTRRLNEIRVNLLATGLEYCHSRADHNKVSLRKVVENTDVTDGADNSETSLGTSVNTSASQKYHRGAPPYRREEVMNSSVNAGKRQ